MWKATALQEAICGNRAHLPDLVTVTRSPDVYLPPVLVGDDAFPLERHLIKLFGGVSLTEDKGVFN